MSNNLCYHLAPSTKKVSFAGQEETPVGNGHLMRENEQNKENTIVKEYPNRQALLQDPPSTTKSYEYDSLV